MKPAAAKKAPLYEEGELANGDQGEKCFKRPQSCFACQPPLDRGGSFG